MSLYPSCPCQVRAKEVFIGFDRRNKGYLDLPEMREMIKALMPEVTEADIRYFLVRWVLDKGLGLCCLD